MDDKPTTPGIYEQVLQPGDRRYTIAFPDGYTDERPRPLVIGLHWGGPVTPYVGKWYLLGLLAPALGELGAILAAPDCTAEHWAVPSSEQVVIDLLDHLQRTYKIDSRRVLLAGYSMGGIGAWLLAARHQERFSGVLIVSAKPPADVVDVDWEIPLYVIHSRRDELFPLRDTQTTVNKLHEKGVPIEIDVVDNTTHFQTERFIEPVRAALPWVRDIWRSEG
jgi:predicted peptidase